MPTATIKARALEPISRDLVQSITDIQRRRQRENGVPLSPATPSGRGTYHITMSEEESEAVVALLRLRRKCTRAQVLEDLEDWGEAKEDTTSRMRRALPTM
jgi:hypothetical protein